MNNHTRREHVVRESILKLLSDDEVARVSHLEATTSLLEGEEYLDLEELEQGVRAAVATNAAPMGHVLPRRAVDTATWDKILEQLAARQTSRWRVLRSLVRSVGASAARQSAGRRCE
jgi:hypothetical protein